MTEEYAIQILKEFISMDRMLRNNSTESDYDKFCEVRCQAIEIALNLIETQKTEIEKKDKRISDLEFALMDMVLQFADEDKEKINTMGLSALEIAFTELDLYDPIDKKEVEKKYAELAAKYYGLVEGEKKDGSKFQ